MSCEFPSQALEFSPDIPSNGWVTCWQTFPLIVVCLLEFPDSTLPWILYHYVWLYNGHFPSITIDFLITRGLPLPPPTTCLYPLQVPQSSSAFNWVYQLSTCPTPVYPGYIFSHSLLMQPGDISKHMRKNVVMTGTHFVVSPPSLKAHTRMNSLSLLTFVVSSRSICIPLHLKPHASQVCSFLLWATSKVQLSPSTHLPKLGKFGLPLAPSLPPSG